MYTIVLPAWVLLGWLLTIIVQLCQSSPQSPESPCVSPLPKSWPVSTTRVEDLEKNHCHVPCSSDTLSVANCISEWEERSVPDSRQGHLTPSSPANFQAPAASSAKQARRRALWCSREEEAACSLSPTSALGQTERIYWVSELDTDRQ